MFGLALRTYHDKVRRLSESRSFVGRSLWDAVHEFLATEDTVVRADVLRRFQARVRGLEIPDDEKALATRRLLAISDASKHDVARAAKRLSAFMTDLDEGRISASERPDIA